MKYGMYLWAVVIFFSFQCCKSAASKAKEQERSAQTEQALEKQNFQVMFKRAFPRSSATFNRVFNQLHLAGYSGNTAGSIDLTSHHAYLKVHGDSISADLPFYGERYMGAGYNRSESIKMEGIPEEFSIHKKSKYTEIRFQIRDKKNKMDTYNGLMRIYENAKVDLNLVSTHRSTIGYLGEINFSDD